MSSRRWRSGNLHNDYLTNDPVSDVQFVLAVECSEFPGCVAQKMYYALKQLLNCILVGITKTCIPPGSSYALIHVRYIKILLWLLRLAIAVLKCHAIPYFKLYTWNYSDQFNNYHYLHFRSPQTRGSVFPGNYSPWVCFLGDIISRNLLHTRLEKLQDC